MKTKLVRIKTSDGLTLEGLLFEPEEKSSKVIIHVHGSAGNFYENKFIDDFSEEYTKAGYAFLAFNNRGAEFEKEKNQGEGTTKKHVILGLLNEIFEECILDIQAAIDFVKSKDYSEVILQGHSLGCNKVVWYALEKKFNGKLILLAPCDLARERDAKNLANIEKAKQLIKDNKGLERLSGFWGHWNITAKSLISQWSENVNADMFRYRDRKIVSALAKLKNKILIEIGTKDQCYDQENKQECVVYLKKAFKNAEVKADLIEGVRHHYQGKEKQVTKNVLAWLN